MVYSVVYSTSTSVSSGSLLPCSKIAASIDVHRSRGRLNSTLLSPQNPNKAGSMRAVWFLIRYPTTCFFRALLKSLLKFGPQNKKHQHQYQKTTVLISNPIRKKLKNNRSITSLFMPSAKSQASKSHHIQRIQELLHTWSLPDTEL